jgi:hypothetical protein
VLSHLRARGIRLLAWWIQWWWVDALLAATIAVLLRESLRAGTGADLLGELKLVDRLAAYTNMLQLTAIFAGFSGVGFAIYVGLNSRSVQKVKVQAGAPLLRVWLAALVTPWICTLTLVFCGITDRGDKDSANFTRWVALAALTVVVLQLARIVWIFYQLSAAEFEAARPITTSAAEPVRAVGRGPAPR